MAKHVDADLARAIGDQIRAVRERKGMSQEDLSFRSGLHRTEVSMLDRGIRIPRVDTLLQVAGGLGVELADLVGHLAWSPPGQAAGGFRVKAPREPGEGA